MRPLIAAVSAALIAALCGVAYLVTTWSLESEVRRDLRDRVANAQDLLLRDAELEALEVIHRIDELARDRRLALTLTGEAQNPEPAARALQEHRAELDENERPDILAVTDESGRLVVLMTGDKRVTSPIPSTYLEGGEIEYPALATALSGRLRIADVFPYESHGPMRVGVAPVFDETGEVVGSVLVAHGITTEKVNRERRQLGAEVSYYYGDHVSASSLETGLPAAIFSEGGIAATALASDHGISEVVSVDIGGDEYIATAGRLPMFSSLGERPAGYPPTRAGTVVAMSVEAALAPLAPIKLAIALIGLGAIVVVLLAMFLTARQLLGPIDDLELVVAEMLDGDLERSFEPKSPDLDGLANGLNVLMARLLGRPQPGEEEYDADGNLIEPATSVRFAAIQLESDDPAAESVASEPVADYYGRLYAEYTAAIRESGGSVAGLTEEAFIHKLRLSETTLCEKYQCGEVRFVVAKEDGEVILRPVPIG